MAVGTLVPEDAQRVAVGVNSASHIDNYVLAANVAQNMAKPTSGNYVLMTADGGFWAAYDKTASSGSTNITDGTGSEYMPGSPGVWRNVSGVTNISVIATSARKISLLWRK